MDDTPTTRVDEAQYLEEILHRNKTGLSKLQDKTVDEIKDRLGVIKARTEKEKQAAENRRKFGRTKEEKRNRSEEKHQDIFIPTRK